MNERWKELREKAARRKAEKKALIPLAEAMWPEKNIFHLQPGQDDGGYVGYNVANGSFRNFDPIASADDCEKMIAWLMTQGWHVEVKFQSYGHADREAEYVSSFGVFLHIWNVDTEQHERTACSLDCWKRCLFDLATRVLN